MTTDEELPPLNPIRPLDEDAAMLPSAAVAERASSIGSGPAAGATSPPTPVANPYVPPSAEAEEIVTAEPLHQPAAGTRIWRHVGRDPRNSPRGLIGGVILAAAMFASGGPELFGEGTSMTGWLEDFAQTRWGLLVLIVPGQLVFSGGRRGSRVAFATGVE